MPIAFPLELLSDSQLAALQITLQYSYDRNHFPQYKPEQLELLTLIEKFLTD